MTFVSPPGIGILSDILQQSPIISGGGDGGGGGGNLNEFGVDPELDPDLAMAMAMSMEEARRAEEGPGGESGDAAAAAPAAPAAPAFAVDEADAELQAALAMSMEGVDAAPAEETTPMETDKPAEGEAAAGGDMYSDPSFLSDVISELEGVDPNDPEARALPFALSSCLFAIIALL